MFVNTICEFLLVYKDCYLGCYYSVNKFYNNHTDMSLHISEYLYTTNYIPDIVNLYKLVSYTHIKGFLKNLIKGILHLRRFCI